MKNITPDPGGFVSILVLDMDAYAEKYGEKAVKKISPYLHGSILLLKITALTFHRYSGIP